MSQINEILKGILCFMANNQTSVEMLSPDLQIHPPDSSTFEQKISQGVII